MCDWLVKTVAVLQQLTNSVQCQWNQRPYKDRGSEKKKVSMSSIVLFLVITISDTKIKDSHYKREPIIFKSTLLVPWNCDSSEKIFYWCLSNLSSLTISLCIHHLNRYSLLVSYNVYRVHDSFIETYPISYQTFFLLFKR